MAKEARKLIPGIPLIPAIGRVNLQMFAHFGRVTIIQNKEKYLTPLIGAPGMEVSFTQLAVPPGGPGFYVLTWHFWKE